MIQKTAGRTDFCHLSDAIHTRVPRKSKALACDRFMKRVVFTKKKMGAQTLEALVHASLEQRVSHQERSCGSEPVRSRRSSPSQPKQGATVKIETDV